MNALNLCYATGEITVNKNIRVHSNVQTPALNKCNILPFYNRPEIINRWVVAYNRLF